MALRGADEPGPDGPAASPYTWNPRKAQELTWTSSWMTEAQDTKSRRTGLLYGPDDAEGPDPKSLNRALSREESQDSASATKRHLVAMISNPFGSRKAL